MTLKVQPNEDPGGTDALNETQGSIRKSLGVNVWIKDRLESITTQKSPKTLRRNFRKLRKRRSTFINVDGVEYKICMEKVSYNSSVSRVR